jgi:hypothetical protein
MLEYSLRFLAGGIAVSGFAALGDTLRPKSFAGLFGAALSHLASNGFAAALGSFTNPLTLLKPTPGKR